MNSVHAARLLATTVLAFGITLPAYAEQSEQGASASGAGDIIVTARRTEERLQDVPISITVFNQEEISRRNIVVATDLATYTPSLSVNQRYGPEKASFAIRGFSQDPGTAPTVGVYFAEVVGVRAEGGTVSGNTVGAGAFMDLQNVQVLKGPQGTLFGRNTTGGAILLVPQKPTDHFEGYVEGSAGNFDMWRTQAVVNVPLADTFKVRVAVDRNKRDGYMRNQSGIGPDSYNDVNYFAARLSVVADLTPDLENYTIAHYSNSFSRGYAARLALCNEANSALTAQAACDQIDRQAARGDGPLDVDVSTQDPYVKIKQWQVINTTTWRASDNLTIKNIASYGEYGERVNFNLNSDNFAFPAFLPPGVAGQPFQYIQVDTRHGGGVRQSTFTNELQFQGETNDGRLNWQVGGYLESSRALGGDSGLLTGILLNCASVADLECTNPLGAGFISDSRTQYSFDNNGLYAQATYKLTDQFAFTGGIRYTMDRIRGVSTSTNYRPFNDPAVRTCYNTLVFSTPDGPDAGTARDPLAVTDPSECAFRLENNSNRLTWLANVDYKPTDDILLYAKYSRGYRQGGISFTNIGIEKWKPETLDAYEIGAKTTFRGSVPGYFNVAAFYNDFRGQQINGGLGSKDITQIAGGSGIANAGKSRIQGVEVDAAVTLFDSLQLQFAYTYLDTKVIELVPVVLAPDSPFSDFRPSAEEGDPLALSPKNRLTASATYTVPFSPNVGKVSLGATFVHTDKQVANAGSPIGVLPATDILNLNVDWSRAFGSPVDLAFFVTNVTDEIYPVNVTSGYYTQGFDSYLMAPPRMWGFRLRYNFGG